MYWDSFAFLICTITTLVVLGLLAYPLFYLSTLYITLLMRLRAYWVQERAYRLNGQRRPLLSATED